MLFSVVRVNINTYICLTSIFYIIVKPQKKLQVFVQSNVMYHMVSKCNSKKPSLHACVWIVHNRQIAMLPVWKIVTNDLNTKHK